MVGDSELVQEYNKCSLDQVDLPAPPLETLPLLLDAQRALRKAPAGKAAGLDGIVGDFGRVAQAEIGRLVYPLLLKTNLQQREPLGFKSGEVVFFHKGKGAADVMQNQRNILLGSTIGKLHH
eukprot:3248280-Pyramimonas_sp.AAC.1